MLFTLEELKDTIKLFSANQCNYLTDNCIVAMELCEHKSGCILDISGDQINEAEIKWTTKVQKAGYKEQKKIVEHGAEAISFFLARKFTEYSVLEEATIGTGFDYWLGYGSDHSNYNPTNFISARLEISGIFKESSQNSVQTRVNQKKNQTKPSDSLMLPAYISVVEFSHPKAYFGKK